MDESASDDHAHAIVDARSSGARRPGIERELFSPADIGEFARQVTLLPPGMNIEHGFRFTAQYRRRNRVLTAEKLTTFIVVTSVALRQRQAMHAEPALGQRTT